MALETISPEYKATYRRMEVQKRSNAIRSFVRKLNQGKTLVELHELARVAHDELQIEAAVNAAASKAM
ncbi:hypothetical protein LP417_35605 (plasmid) [Polaromonas sp. P1-6]|nr:hypothetical protein LP417_35605 [Polaromonas sp. P1-6]